MKKFITLLAAFAVIFGVSAEINGDGYYRVHNFGSGRYIYVLDNHGSLNMQATSADLGALEVWMDLDRAISDPASVIYVKSMSNDGRFYDFQSQGTGVMSIINRSVRVRYWDDNTGKYYRIWGEDSGMVRYIGDGCEENESEKGYVSSVQPYKNDYVKWYFTPITSESSNYFGVKPTVNVDGKWYAPFYADFPFSPASEGMKAWYVSKLDGNMAVISEYKGVVPASFPVLIECSSNDVSKNKINIGGTAGEKPQTWLRGVYFKNESLSHPNTTKYNPTSMRLFGITAEGKAGFITATDKYVPRNAAYLFVPEGSEKELFIITEEEYKLGVTGIDAENIKVRTNGRTIEVSGANGSPIEVYNLAGSEVYSGTGSSITLANAGVYIVRIHGKAYKVIAK